MIALSRRTVIRHLILGGITNGLLSTLMPEQSAGASTTDGDPLRIRWRVPQGQLKKVQDRLRDFDGEVKGDPSSPGDARGAAIYLLIGTTIVPYLVDALMAVYRDLKYGGLVVQAKPNGELDIQHDRKLDGSTIIVKTSEGVVVYRTRNGKTSTELVDILTKLSPALSH